MDSEINKMRQQKITTVMLASAQAQSFSAEDLTHRTVERRVVEAVNWGMPAVNFDLMFRAMIDSARVASQPGFYHRRKGPKDTGCCQPLQFASPCAIPQLRPGLREC